MSHTSIKKPEHIQHWSKLFFHFSYINHRKIHLWRVTLCISRWVEKGQIFLSKNYVLALFEVNFLLGTTKIFAKEDSSSC